MSTSDDVGEVTKKPRAIVLCFDGTANEYSGKNTNVVKFVSLLKKDDFNEQLCYYQPGIGTWFNPGVVSPMCRWGAKILDQAFAWYLDAHVIDGYRFLMQNYRVGDRICIFGFSRGSYTARALAGALHAVGLLSKDNEQQIPFAYKLYKREDQEGIALCAGFKQTFCRSVKIEFVGVWDTVESVGLVMRRSLPFTNSNTIIKTFRHALSLDEHRGKFRPNLYHHSSPGEAGVALHRPTTDPEAPSFSSSNKSGKIRLIPRRGIVSWFKKPLKISVDDIEEDGDPTDVLEVWFAGCHTDVGGSAVPDADRRQLSNISLRWMVREVIKSQCGIEFDEHALSRAFIPAFDFLAEPTDTNDEEKVLDAADALEPIHDQLKLNRMWWILEIVPLSYSWQDEEGVWHTEWNCHLGRGRKIPGRMPVFHITVKQRMADSKLKYKPKAQWIAGSEVYVD